MGAEGRVGPVRAYATMKETQLLTAAMAVACCCLAITEPAFGQGSLTPPGPPGPTMLRLDQLGAKLEKRTPISSLPYSITQPGSYYVTGNLTGLDGKDGITVTANDVTIDLSGFALTGSAGAQTGIHIAGGPSGVAVVNGTLRGWPASGINAFDNLAVRKSATGCRFAQLHLVSNGTMGINSGYSAMLRDCVADGNNGTGFQVGQGSTVDNCAATKQNNGAGFVTYVADQLSSSIYAPVVFRGCSSNSNVGNGFFVGFCILENCEASSNAPLGFSADRSMLRGCSAHSNTINGFNLTSCVAETSVATNNGSSGSGDGFDLSYCEVKNCLAQFNKDHGFSVSSANRISQCNAFDNTGAGIFTSGTGNVIASNNVASNVNGIRAATGNSPSPPNLIYGNTAASNTGNGGNYYIDAGNRVGTIVVPAVSGAVAGNIGANGFGSADPWINIGY